MDPALIFGTIWKGSHHDTKLLGDGNDRWATRLNRRCELTPFGDVQIIGPLCIAIRDSISDPQCLIRGERDGPVPYMRAKGILGGASGWTSRAVYEVSDRDPMQ